MNKHNEIFTSELTIYQKILANNYLNHKQFYETLHNFLVDHFSQPFSLLDLGCGDASCMAKSLLDTKINSYTGVDLSNLSLENAATNMKAISCKQNFIMADLYKIVSDLEQKKYVFDCIFSGFALHHLNYEQKADFFPKIPKLLTKTGIFLFLDTFLQTNETREEYLDKRFKYIDNWHELNKEEINLVKSHVFNNDLPETKETIDKFAQKDFKIIKTIDQDFGDTARYMFLALYPAD